ncbi:MAG: hypothetical protein ACOC6G_03300 [Thermoproteota archaeon]
MFKLFQDRLEEAEDYSEVWKVVKDSVEYALGKSRQGMMLFLDDLPLRLGAYHPWGTNNIVLNRTLVELVEDNLKSKRAVNSLIYNLLLHEYLHALGDPSERKVRQMVFEVCQKCFGESYIATSLAHRGPWSLLSNIPLYPMRVSKRGMEIVKDFEEPGGYII